jgi:hypothetical protein
MALDIYLLYGEMVGSWIVHIAIVMGMALFVKLIMADSTKFMKIMTFAGLCCLASFLFQSMFLISLQANSCSGVKNYGNVFIGSTIATAITAVMIAIPIFISPLRLIVSQLFMEHNPDLEGNEEQTFQEIKCGAGFWAAFAGAYGVGIGSLFAGKC